MVDGTWRLLLYVCICCRDGCVHCMCTRPGLPFVTMAKYSTVNAFVPTSCPTAFDRTALQAKSQVSAARSVSLRQIVCLNNGSALDCQGQGSSIGGLRAGTTTLKILLVVTAVDSAIVGEASGDQVVIFVEKSDHVPGSNAFRTVVPRPTRLSTDRTTLEKCHPNSTWKTSRLALRDASAFMTKL